MKRFFESKPEFPKSSKNRSVRITKVKEILERVTCAGCVENPNWGVSLRKGHHEPLISFETHERILARLHGTVLALARKDINEDFIWRGHLLCDDCD